MYRSSAGELDRYDEPPRMPERWDREKFESMRRGGGGGGDGASVAGGSRAGGSVAGGSRAGGGRAGGRGGDDYEHFHFQEHDRFPGGRRDVDIHEDRQRRGSRVLEKERIQEDERFERPSRRRDDIFNEPTPSEVANQALAPYRRKSVIDKDINIDINIHENQQPARPARPARPGYIRRQSSLDTFDRRPLPRYAAIERYETHEYRPPPNMPIPLPIRERRRSPPRRFREEEEFEEFRFDDRGEGGREREEYREVEVRKEKSRVRRSKSVAKSTRSSSMSSFEEIQPSRATWGKKGKTKLPKRLVKKQAVIDLGYPFEEEDDFIIVTRALEKDHIDEVIKISESYKEEKTTYVYEDKESDKESDKKSEAPPPPASYAPPPPPPPEFYPAPPPSIMHASPPPPPPVYALPPPSHHAPSHYAPPHYAPSERAPSPSIHEHERFVEIERSNAMRGPATAFLPEGRQLVRRRSERDIREEIRSLEEERRMLKYEREGERDYEFIETRPARREVVRVDKDRKVRRDRPNPKIVAAMMSTLT